VRRPDFVPPPEEFALIALDSKAQRLNAQITAPEVRLVGEEGEQLGIVSITEAMRMAEEKEIDLVEIAPMAVPPVCKLMDFGKFKYREQKKAHEAKLKQKQIQVKEVKFRPGTDEGDYKIKLRNLIRFLEEGDKTKVTLRFRGREMAHQEFGVRLLERIRADLEPHGIVENFPRMEGRQMVMVLGPKKKEVKAVVPKPKKPASAAGPKAEGAPPQKAAEPKPAAA
jgi:translation initiation factor IF-3